MEQGREDCRPLQIIISLRAVVDVNAAMGGTKGTAKIVVRLNRRPQEDNPLDRVGRHCFRCGQYHARTGAVGEEIDPALGLGLFTPLQFHGQIAAPVSRIATCNLIDEHSPIAVGPGDRFDSQGQLFLVNDIVYRLRSSSKIAGPIGNVDDVLARGAIGARKPTVGRYWQRSRTTPTRPASPA